MEHSYKLSLEIRGGVSVFFVGGGGGGGVGLGRRERERS